MEQFLQLQFGSMVHGKICFGQYAKLYPRDYLQRKTIDEFIRSSNYTNHIWLKHGDRFILERSIFEGVPEAFISYNIVDEILLSFKNDNDILRVKLSLDTGNLIHISVFNTGYEVC